MRGVLATLLLSLMAFHARADQFIEAFFPVRSFWNFGGSPYNYTAPNSRQGLNAVDIACEQIAKRVNRLQDLSAEFLKTTQLASIALSNNNEIAFKDNQAKLKELSLSMAGTRSALEVIRAGPIYGRKVIEADDPIAGFLIKAALIPRGNVQLTTEWLDSLSFVSIKSSLPVYAWRAVLTTPKEASAKFDINDVKFSHADMPDRELWRQSNERKRQSYPLELGIGWDGKWPACEDRKCYEKQLTLVLDLTQGQYCAGLTGERQSLLAFTIEFPSARFGNDRILLTYRVGELEAESEVERKARIEGHNKALDYLLGTFIKDVFGTAQIYRVSDEYLRTFDAGAYREGKTLKVTNLKRKLSDVKSVSLRNALNAMNSGLLNEFNPSADKQIVSALQSVSRYGGSVWQNGQGDQEYVATFQLRANSRIGEIGFLVDRTNQLRVAYVALDEDVLYYHPFFYCGKDNTAYDDRHPACRY